MIVPGSNLLNLALTVISPTGIQWYRYLSETINEIGNSVKTYDEPVNIKGSLQPVDTNKYEELGLDFKKTWFLLYTSQDIRGVDRDYSGDYILYNGIKYSGLDEKEWITFDGWNKILLTKVP